MKFLNRMERRFGRYAIQNLTLYIIATYVLGYVLEFAAPAMTQYLYLDPYFILHGQVWRLVSWLLVPPSSLDIFTIIMLFFYYSIGTELEHTWGTFRYNVFIFGGLLWTIIGSFILFGVMFILYGSMVAFGAFGAVFSTYYISLSIFLAFAITYPDMRVMLYFIIPLKIKYLAYLDVAYLVYIIFVNVRQGMWYAAVAVICSLMNVLIYFMMTRNLNRVNPREIHRKQQFKKAVNPGRAQAGRNYIHKCAICGRTEKDDPNLEFRYCSRCKGNYEYCQDHLFTHKHVE